MKSKSEHKKKNCASNKQPLQNESVDTEFKPRAFAKYFHIWQTKRLHQRYIHGLVAGAA